MNLYKSGQVDAATAMQMLADLSASEKARDSDNKEPSSSAPTVPTKKRERSADSNDEPKETDIDISDNDVDDIAGQHLDSRLSLNCCQMLPI